MKSFKTYITEVNLSPAQLKKRDNMDTFAEKIRDSIPFIASNGQEVILGYRDKSKNLDLYNQILDKGIDALEQFRERRSIMIPTVSGRKISLGQLKKTAEFGGSQRKGTEKEDAQLRRLNEIITRIASEENIPYVPIKVAGQVHNVLRFESTPGTPKSDFHAIDEDGNECIWVSHKDGSTAKDFSQYGGMSKRVEPKIAAHPEVIKFVADVKKWLEKNGHDAMPPKTTLARVIKDRTLKGMSIYGNEFGSNYSRQNCQVLLQGKLGLKKSGKVYELVASGHVQVNPEMPKEESYEPTLMVMHKTRKDYGIDKARFSIYTKSGRKVTEFI
jgi:hypothetical protein